MASDAWDHPLIFAFSITMVVIGMSAVLSWAFASMNWTGPLGLVKGGVA